MLHAGNIKLAKRDMTMAPKMTVAWLQIAGNQVNRHKQQFQLIANESILFPGFYIDMSAPQKTITEIITNLLNYFSLHLCLGQFNTAEAEPRLHNQRL